MTDDLRNQIESARQQARAAREREARLSAATSGPLSGCAQPAMGESFAVVGYELHGVVHRGAQGVVYRATKSSTGRDVAIKVLRDGPFAGPGDRARFEREVQVLGQIEHRHIVTIHDTGITNDHHYFVMDFVAGQPLDEYVSSRQLDPRETLMLFRKICAAVEAAHLRGVIHRDLKPGNILIDVDGEPRILDFGLAKVTTESDTTVMTATGQFVGTLPWASPEQVRDGAAGLDVRSDVYSIGVMLYQVLTGTFPYEVVGPVRDIMENICQAEPLRPSTLGRRVNDEIETIVLKCLAKDPRRRYQTSGELGRDIARYLDGEAIEAKRDSAWYVVRKQIRRHRVAVAISTLLLLLIIQAVVGLAIANRRESRLRRDAEAALAESTRQGRITQAVSAFLNRDVLAAVAPERRGLDTTLREVLDTAAAEIGERFSDEPAVAASIHLTIGNSYLSMGEFDSADRHLTQAYELREAALGPQDLDTLEVANQLGMLNDTRGRYDPALQWYRIALDGRRQALGEDHADTIESGSNLAVTLMRIGQYEDSESMFLALRERAERTLGDHEQTSAIAHNLGTLYYETGRLAEAEPLIQYSLEWSERTAGHEHPDTLTSRNMLANILSRQGKYDEAEHQYKAVIAARERVLGEGHLYTLFSMNGLAVMYSNQGRTEEAGRYHEAVLERARRTMTLEDQNLISFVSNVATQYNTTERYEDAEPLHAEAVAAARAALPERHWLIGLFLYRYGYCLTHLERFEDAEAALLEAESILTETIGADHRHTLRAVRYLAQLYERMDRPDDAARWQARLPEQS